MSEDASNAAGGGCLARGEEREASTAPPTVQKRSCTDDSEDEEDEEAAWGATYAPPPRFEEPGFESPRFEVGDPAALEYLRENGYAVFAEALSSEEVQSATDLFWEFLEEVTRDQVRRDEPETWGSPFWPGQPSNGLFGAPGIGQAPFMWFVRTRPAVLRVFADIWGLKEPSELIMSFDGASAFRPTAIEPGWRTRGGWFHTDQNGRTTGSEFVCAQGFVALTDQDDTTGGLAVFPGSHKHHSDIFQRWPLKRENDFFVLPRVDPLFSRSSPSRARLVRVRAGDLAIWDSRCLHCNVPARHRFDEAPLDEALASAGLSEAGAPLLQNLTSVSDACWVLAAVTSNGGGNIEGALKRWGLAPENMAPVLKAVASWSAELNRDLMEQGKALLTSPAKLARTVAYVCAIPRARVPTEVLPRRVKAALLGGTTTHWPDKCLVFSSNPSRRNIGFILRQEPLVLRLIGCQGDDINEMHEDLSSAWQKIHEEAAERRARREAAEAAAVEVAAAKSAGGEAAVVEPAVVEAAAPEGAGVRSESEVARATAPGVGEVEAPAFAAAD